MIVEKRCPECLSTNLGKWGSKWKKNKESGKRERVKQVICKDCGRITVNPLEVAKL